MKLTKDKLKETIDQEIDDLPGATIDSADHETVDPKLVRERTHTLNNNPRDTDGPKD